MMIDMEKVIKGLEVCTSKPCYCTDCPYKANCCLDSQEVMEDALELLKEQTHGETFTVIDTKTGKEAYTYNIALHEDWAKNLCYCGWKAGQ